MSDYESTDMELCDSEDEYVSDVRQGGETRYRESERHYRRNGRDMSDVDKGSTRRQQTRLRSVVVKADKKHVPEDKRREGVIVDEKKSCDRMKYYEKRRDEKSKDRIEIDRGHAA